MNRNVLYKLLPYKNDKGLIVAVGTFSIVRLKRHVSPVTITGNKFFMFTDLKG